LNASSPMLVTPLGMIAVPAHSQPFVTMLSVTSNDPVVHATVVVAACAL
jgi:hypothetical protein